jgi:uncharacterized protein
LAATSKTKDQRAKTLVHQMETSRAFLNEAGRLRSGWRVGIFVIAFAVTNFVLGYALRIGLELGLKIPFLSIPIVGEFLFRIILVLVALGIGWLCARFLEGLPWRSLGLSLHQNWWWDFLIGSLIGALALVLAVLIAFAAGGLRFSFSGTQVISATLRGLTGTAALFVLGGLAEEAIFRGYVLQTLTRAKLAWLGVLLTSVPFALVHLANPNVAAGFTFVNTVLAGVWLAAAYLRTRSLWFPLGVHWAWNWVLGSVFGLPVSGLRMTSHTLLFGHDFGPAWLTGGSYGIEGGLACTIALIFSTLFIWRTKLVSTTPEMMKLTGGLTETVSTAMTYLTDHEQETTGFSRVESQF